MPSLLSSAKAPVVVQMEDDALPLLSRSTPVLRPGTSVAFGNCSVPGGIARPKTTGASKKRKQMRRIASNRQVRDLLNEVNDETFRYGTVNGVRLPYQPGETESDYSGHTKQTNNMTPWRREEQRRIRSVRTRQGERLRPIQHRNSYEDKTSLSRPKRCDC